MPARLTTKEFIEKAINIHGNKYNYKNVVYVNNDLKVAIICQKHGQFMQCPNAHLVKSGCPKCSKENLSIIRTFTKEQFISKAKKVHGNKYNYEESQYINNHTHLIIICPKHGKFLQTPNSHLSGTGCPKCCGNQKLNTNIFIKRAKKLYGNKYDYSQSNYINKRTPVVIICPKHGIFKMTPHYHIFSKHGCPKCKQYDYLKKFIKEAKNIHGNKYSYKKVNYKNSFTKVTIICPIHGDFLSMPTDHIYKKAGCWKCSKFKKLTTQQFIDRAKEIHGNKYDYSKVNYKNCKNAVKIICKKHGIFLSNPNHHIHSKAGCPKCNLSKRELLIAEILNKNKIPYITQKTFPNCRNPKTKTMLKYDFYLPTYNVLIEHNGAQHYQEVKRWHINKSTLKELQYRDSLKKEYAISHGYKFVVIKYTDNIEKSLMKIF